jgi:hypothetical protein
LNDGETAGKQLLAPEAITLHPAAVRGARLLLGSGPAALCEVCCRG